MRVTKKTSNSSHRESLTTTIMSSRAVSLSREPSLRREAQSFVSLSGMEQSLPPSYRFDSAESSVSDLIKALPSPPFGRTDKDRTSSIYSNDIGDLIELYVSRDSNSHYEDSATGPSNTDRYGKSLQSKSVPQARSPLATMNSFPSPRTEYGATRYRYSSPEPPSPKLKQSPIVSIDWAQDTHDNDLANAYRDILPSTPFTSMYVKSVGTGDIMLLHKSAPLKSPGRYDNSGSSAYSPVFSRTTYDETSSNQTPSSLTDSSNMSAYRYNEGYSTPSITSSSESISPESKSISRPRPAPLGYDGACCARRDSNDSDGDSSSDSASLYSSDSIDHKPVLTNWSLFPKPSNPNVPRIPKSERSPAVGLSAYQTHGPKAWIEEDENTRKQRKGILGLLMNGTKRYPEQSVSKSSGPQKPPRLSLHFPSSSLDLSSVRDHVRHISGYARPKTPADPGSPLVKRARSMSRLRRTRSTNSLFLALRPSSRAGDAESIYSVQTVNGRYQKGISWLGMFKQKPAEPKEDTWKTDIKKRITVVSATDSIGLSGHSALLNGDTGRYTQSSLGSYRSEQASHLRSGRATPNPGEIRDPTGTHDSWI